MSLVEQVSAGIMEAMKAKNTDRLRALRSIKSTFLLLKSAEGAGEVTDELCIKALQKMAKQRKDSLDIYIEQGREDLALVEHSDLAVINGFLPTQLSQSEIEARVKQLIGETGSLSLKDLGKVMPLAMKSMVGIADGKLISETVKKLLT